MAWAASSRLDRAAPSLRSTAPHAVRSRSGKVLISYIGGPPCTSFKLSWAVIFDRQDAENETNSPTQVVPVSAKPFLPQARTLLPREMCTVMLPLWAKVPQGKRGARSEARRWLGSLRNCRQLSGGSRSRLATDATFSSPFHYFLITLPLS